jgi:beta-mannosidase
MASRSVIPVDKNWEFRQGDKEDSKFLPVGQFPTNVHLDLLHHKLIPDPYIGKNELDVQWIGEAQWIYRTVFEADAVPEGSKAILVFDGLDTFATVVLNGTTILETDNMFTPERVDVTSALKKENELVITFDSAYLRGWKLIEQYPEYKWGCWNGDSSRLAVRKAQYHWVSRRTTTARESHVRKLTLLGMGLGSSTSYLRPMEASEPRDLQVSYSGLILGHQCREVAENG